MSELSSLDVPEIDTNKIDTNQRSYISKGRLMHVKIYAKTLHKCKLSHSDQKRTDSSSTCSRMMMKQDAGGKLLVTTV